MSIATLYRSLLLALLFWGVTSAANAQGLDIDSCASGLPPHAYTTKVVVCVTASMLQASREMATMLASYMAPVALAMLSLAVTWLGVQILGGERQLTQKSVTLSIKIGVVSYFFFFTDQIAGVVLAVLQQFLMMLNAGYEPFTLIDTMIGKLLGFGPTLAITQGLLGILGATLMSSTTGIFLFLAGFVAMLDIFFFIFNVTFTYLLAIMLICFMLALTPFFAPMLLFYSTEKYFNKWWHIIVSAGLVPILMFTFLYFFFRIFHGLVGNIFEILGYPCTGGNLASCDDPDFTPYWKMNQPLFAWLMPADPSFSQQIQNMAQSDQLSIPAVQSNVNPLLRRAYNTNMMNVPGVNFGPNDVAIKEQLLFALISLWIFASLMKSIITKIPTIADDIAGSLNRITVQPTQIETTTRKMLGASPEQLQKTSAKLSDNLKQTIDSMRNMATKKRS